MNNHDGGAPEIKNRLAEKLKERMFSPNADKVSGKKP